VDSSGRDSSGSVTPLASPGYVRSPTDAMRAVVQRTSSSASPPLPPRRLSAPPDRYRPSALSKAAPTEFLDDDDGSDASSVKYEYETVEQAGRAIDFRAATLASNYASHTVDADSGDDSDGDDEGLYSIFVGTTPGPPPAESRGKNIFRKRSSTTTPEPQPASEAVGVAGPAMENARQRSPSPDPFTRPATPEHNWASEFVKQHTTARPRQGANNKPQTALV
jgi:hypothetical protein